MTEQERMERALRERERLRMMNDINTEEFKEAFQLWCVFMLNCRLCKFRRNPDGCVEQYYKKYYKPQKD